MASIRLRSWLDSWRPLCSTIFSFTCPNHHNQNIFGYIVKYICPNLSNASVKMASIRSWLDSWRPLCSTIVVPLLFIHLSHPSPLKYICPKYLSKLWNICVQIMISKMGSTILFLFYPIIVNSQNYIQYDNASKITTQDNICLLLKTFLILKR